MLYKCHLSQYQETACIPNGEKLICSTVGKSNGLKCQMSSSLHMYFVYLHRLHFKDILLKDQN